MKQCPKCSKTYSDIYLNFCLEDGELLTQMFREPDSGAFRDDPPPTIMMNDARITNPMGGWQQMPAPPVAWQAQGMQQFPMMVPPNQTLAIVSLCLGIGSVTIGWCCSIGLVLSPAALITGFIALSHIKKDPQRNAGRGLAIGGIVAAAIYIAVLVLIIVFYGAAILLSGLNP